MFPAFSLHLTEQPTTVFGEKLRDQVEERLSFFLSRGSFPAKTYAVMQEAISLSLSFKPTRWTSLWTPPSLLGKGKRVLLIVKDEMGFTFTCSGGGEKKKKKKRKWRGEGSGSCRTLRITPRRRKRKGRVCNNRKTDFTTLLLSAKQCSAVC